MRTHCGPGRTALIEGLESRLCFSVSFSDVPSSGVGPSVPATVAAQPVTITSSVASYVRGGTYAGQNFGTSSDLAVKFSGSSSYVRESYVKFDLSSVRSIAKATLRLYGHLSSTSPSSLVTKIFNASNTSWTETGLTWNNKPVAGTTLRASLTVTGTTAKFYDVDLTSFLQTELAAGRKVVTLVLKNTVSSDAQSIFGSDDSANPPRLLVTPVVNVNRFEVATFNSTPEFSTDHFNQTMFNHLNVASTHGGYDFGMGSDTQRGALAADGNTLAVYYNTLTSLYNGSNPDPIGSAGAIDAYVHKLFTSTGPAPKWVILNEISGSLWPSNATYRTWLIDTMARLHEFYGYDPIVYSPFGNPAANDASWQLLSKDAYIGVEQYLSGEEVKNNNFSVAWAQSVYQSSKTSYLARGVPADHIFIGEHFGQTTAGTGWGRAGVSAADWKHAIQVRDQAIYNVNFAGFLSYAWGKNGMQVSDAELTSYEDAHMADRVLQTEAP